VATDSVPTDPTTAPPIIRATAVSKSYGEGGRRHSVLRGLALEVGAGECIALLGRSGSGKTSLLNLLSGIDLPDSGEIVVGGNPINALSEAERTRFRRRNVGFIFQFFNLIPTLTVLENLLLPLELNGIDDRQRATTLLGQMGLARRHQDFPDLLSGGEQQRVAIARALVHDPLLVFADEPTGNLDTETGEQVIGVLFDSVRRRAATLVMVTHSLHLAERADRILKLEAGVLR
jgi:putative ABC transport system ATP-binding protein